jgi:uncharacterized caspase-like protein
MTNRYRCAMLFLVWLGLLARGASAEMFALIVGVNDCPQFRLPGGARPRPLRGAESDARAFLQLLKEQYGVPEDHLRLIVGGQANRINLAQAWKDMARKLRREDQFLFYFAGHGTQRKDQRPLDEEDGLDEALCPADVASDGGNLILDDELAAWLDALPSRNVTVILDCCHAGTATKEFDDDVAVRSLPFDQSPTVSRAAPPWKELSGSTKSFDRRFTALYACQPFQQAYERRFPGQKSPQRSGQMTHYLLETLARERAAERLPAREIVEMTRRKLDESFNVSRPDGGDKQVPSLDASRPQEPLWLLAR